MNEQEKTVFALAIEADEKLLGPEQGFWLERLEAEWPNLKLLLQTWIQAGDAENAQILSGALSRFLWMRGHTPIGRHLIEMSLSLDGGSPQSKSLALMGAGNLAYAAGDFPWAMQKLEEAIPFLVQTGNEKGQAQALDRAGMAARQLMELDQANNLHSRAMKIVERLDLPAELALCLNNLGVVAFFRGDLGQAKSYHHQSLKIRRTVEDARGVASSLNNLGQIAKHERDFSLARSLMEEGLEIRKKLNDRWGIAGSQVNLAAIYGHLKQPEAANRHLMEAIEGFKKVGDPLGYCECLETAGEIAYAFQKEMVAVSYFSASFQARTRSNAPRSPLLIETIGKILDDIKGKIELEAYQKAWNAPKEIDAGLSL